MIAGLYLGELFRLILVELHGKKEVQFELMQTRRAIILVVVAGVARKSSLVSSKLTPRG